MEKAQKNDFIEIEFTGRVKDGDVFDTNIKSESEKIGLEIEDKPLIVCVGKDMLVKGFDNALDGKEIGKKYEIELSPKEAFQDRRRELVKLIPLKVFTEKQVNPRAGMTLAIDDMLVKIISVSGGRVLCDFNNPLAGKIVVYNFIIKRKVEDISEKLNSIMDFFLRQRLEFKIEDNKIKIEAQDFYKPVIDMLNQQFKEALGMEMVLEVKKEDVEKGKKEKKKEVEKEIETKEKKEEE